MKQIPLTRGFFAIVDDTDFEWLSQFKWQVHFDGERRYAEGKSAKMHRLITDAPAGMQVDHINGNGLDNRRSNLRICTRSENQCNSKTRSTTGYKGVYPVVRGGYQAVITSKGKRHYLGYFKTPEDAARAYDKKAVELHGEFARLNFERQPDENLL